MVGRDLVATNPHGTDEQTIVLTQQELRRIVLAVYAAADGLAGAASALVARSDDACERAASRCQEQAESIRATLAPLRAWALHPTVLEVADGENA